MTQPRSHDRHDTPAASMFVATNWRKSWKRKCGTPASSNAIRKRFDAQFGFHGSLTSKSCEKTGQSAVTMPSSPVRRSV